MRNHLPQLDYIEILYEKVGLNPIGLKAIYRIKMDDCAWINVWLRYQKIQYVDNT